MTEGSASPEEVPLVRVRWYNALGLVLAAIAFVGTGLLAVVLGLGTAGLISVDSNLVSMIGFSLSILWLVGATAGGAGNV